MRDAGEGAAAAAAAFGERPEESFGTPAAADAADAFSKLDGFFRSGLDGPLLNFGSFSRVKKQNPVNI